MTLLKRNVALEQGEYTENFTMEAYHRVNIIYIYIYIYGCIYNWKTISYGIFPLSVVCKQKFHAYCPNMGPELVN